MCDWPPCPTCEAVSNQFRVPVWEQPEDYWNSDPDYIGCTECNTMHEFDP